MGRVENAEVFRDTERMCRENARLREAIAASRKGQRLILEGTSVGAVGRNRYAEAAQVVVSPKRTFEAANGAEAIILGAFGCGAFRNDPQVVAAAAKKVVAEYRNAFRTIEFAVYCRPGDTANYDEIERAFL